MGVQNIVEADEGPAVAPFREALLRDLRALEQMLDAGALESDVVRAGIEQEMFLVDSAYRPAPIANQVLAELSDPAFTAEIGKFNLEANLPPRLLERGCLRSMETELSAMIERVSTTARQHKADVLLTGILPSIRRDDLTLQNLTEKPRYQELNRAVMDVRGGSYHLLIKGIDELQLLHDNVMPEACCTSFQVHMQLDPRRFAVDYNASLLAAAPVLAVAVKFSDAAWQAAVARNSNRLISACGRRTLAFAYCAILPHASELRRRLGSELGLGDLSRADRQVSSADGSAGGGRLVGDSCARRHTGFEGSGFT
jgi:hypothetical protein